MRFAVQDRDRNKSASRIRQDRTCEYEQSSRPMMPGEVFVQKDCGQRNRNHHTQVVYRSDLRGFAEL
jgi:hypothetical protein